MMGMFSFVAKASARTFLPKRQLIFCGKYVLKDNNDATLRLMSGRLMSESGDSRPRQNFHKECEAGINRHINTELYSSYVYLSMSYYFNRDDVALSGLTKYFKKSSEEEREHAEKFMAYQNKRGGRIVLQPIQKPERDEWGSGLDAMKTALELEKTVNQSLLDLHKLAEANGDAQMADFIESRFLDEQVEAIKEISDHITNLSRVGLGHGEWHFDKKLKGD